MRNPHFNEGLILVFLRIPVYARLLFVVGQARLPVFGQARLPVFGQACLPVFGQARLLWARQE